MNRGASPYALRGQSLAIPNGTLAWPAIRFGRERSGLYRIADGRLGLGIKKFQALELTANDALIRSNAPGTGRVSPLALVRVHPSEADGLETAVDTYEDFQLTGRLALYRQAAGRFGWRLYGSSAGALSLQPDLQVSADGDLLVRNNLSAGGASFGDDVQVSGAIQVSGDAEVGGDLVLTGDIVPAGGGTPSITSLHLTGPGTALTVDHAASIGGLATIFAATITSPGTALTVPNGGITAAGAVQAASFGSNASALYVVNIPNGGALFGGTGLPGTGLALNVPSGNVSLGKNVDVGLVLTLNQAAGQTALSVPSGNASIGGLLTLARVAGQTALDVPTGNAQIGGQLTLSRATGLVALSVPSGDVVLGAALTVNGLSTLKGINGTSLNVGTGPITGGAITGSSLNTSGGTIGVGPITATGNITTTGTIAATGSISGSGLTLSGDIRTSRAGTPTTGYIYYGSTGNNYLGWDGSVFQANGWLSVAGRVTGSEVGGWGIYASNGGVLAAGIVQSNSGASNALYAPNGSLTVGLDASVGRNLGVTGYINGGVTSAGTISAAAGRFGTSGVEAGYFSGGNLGQGDLSVNVLRGNSYIIGSQYVQASGTMGYALYAPNGGLTVGASGSIGLDLTVGRNLQVNGQMNGGSTASGAISVANLTAGGGGVNSSGRVTGNETTWGVYAQTGGVLSAGIIQSQVPGAALGYYAPTGSLLLGYDATVGRNLQVNGYYNGGTTGAGTLNINTLNVGAGLGVSGTGTFYGALNNPGGTLTVGSYHIHDEVAGHARIRQAQSGSCVIMRNDIAAIQGASDAATDLGHTAVRWRFAHLYAIAGQLPINSGPPAYVLHLGGDSAGKPGSSTWTVISDRRTKVAESIRDYKDGLETLLALRPVTYRYNGLAMTGNATDREYVGLVAEEAREVAPDLVRSTPMKLRPEDDEESDVLGVDAHGLTYLLINAVRTLHERLERLEAAS